MNQASNKYINMDEYYKSSVLISFISYNNEYSLVLEKRSKYISQPGEICFPGGKFDNKLDISTKDTAIRETSEELGIEEDKIKNVRYWGTYIAPMSTLIDVYVGILDTDDIYSLPISKEEVEKLLVIPISYFLDNDPATYEIDNWAFPYRKYSDNKKDYIFPAKDLNLPKRYHKPWKGKARSVHVYPNLEVPIWGVTANIIYKFFKQYKSKFNGLNFQNPTDF